MDTVNSRLSSEEIYMCDSLLDLVPKAACRGSGKLGLGIVGTLQILIRYALGKSQSASPLCKATS